MKTYRIMLSPAACADLADIHAYISKDSPANAAAMIDRILKAIERLALAPHRNMSASIPSQQPTRTLPVKSYVVYFKVLECTQVVRILRVWHGSRLPPRI